MRLGIPMKTAPGRFYPEPRLVPNVTRLASAGIVLSLLSGCVVEERTYHRPRPATVVVEETPPVTGEVLIVQAPPPPRHEVIIERPSPQHVWIDGYWVWRENRHVWMAGHWELPPREHAVWVTPRWEARGHGYVFIAGTWRDGPVVVQEHVAAGPAVNVTVKFVAPPPPRPRHEVVIEAQRPSPEHVWIKGYYVWREGRHVWIAGHWERPPHPHAVWIEPRWEHRSEGYVFIEGFWR